MKKIFVFLALIGPTLASCSSGNKDPQLLDEYFRKEFSKPLVMESYIYSRYTSQIISSSTIPELKNIYITNYEFYDIGSALNFKTEHVYSGTLAKFEINASALSLETTNTSMSVYVDADGVLKGTYTWNVQIKPYIYYLAYIYSNTVPLTSADSITLNGLSQSISKQFVTSGHFYNNYTYSFGIGSNMFTYQHGSYEKTTYGKYNEKYYEATYYFDSNPRIEGMTFGTYMVGDILTSSDEDDQRVYSLSQKLNNIFKTYKDTKYITSIS